MIVDRDLLRAILETVEQLNRPVHRRKICHYTARHIRDGQGNIQPKALLTVLWRVLREAEAHGYLAAPEEDFRNFPNRRLAITPAGRAELEKERKNQ